MICLFGHLWAFPRRYTAANGGALDVQRCTRCGRQRISAVQFGRRAIVAIDDGQVVPEREPGPRITSVGAVRFVRAGGLVRDGSGGER